MKGARRLSKGDFAAHENSPSLPLVTRTKSSIPTFPRPRPGKRLPSSSSSSEEDKTATEASKGRRLAIRSQPIANNGDNGIGNGHGGRHPRAVPIPVTTKAGTRSPSTESPVNTKDVATQQQHTSENGLASRLERNGDNHRPLPRHPRSDHHSPRVPFGTRPTKDSSSEDDITTTITNEAIGQELGRNIGGATNDDSQVLEHP